MAEHGEWKVHDFLHSDDERELVCWNSITLCFLKRRNFPTFFFNVTIKRNSLWKGNFRDLAVGYHHWQSWEMDQLCTRGERSCWFRENFNTELAGKGEVGDGNFHQNFHRQWFSNRISMRDWQHDKNFTQKLYTKSDYLSWRQSHWLT